MTNKVCEKCIHYDVCLLHEDNFIDSANKNGFCGKFSSKSQYIKLPCSVGDIVYLPWNYKGIKNIAYLMVTHIIFDREDSYIKTYLNTDDEEFYDLMNGGKFYFSEIGTLVFLNEEDAREALIEL